MNCTSIEQLLVWMNNQLPTEEAKRLDLHLQSGCQLCAKRLDQLRRILAVTSCRELLEPPEWLGQQAMHLFRRHTADLDEQGPGRTPAILLVDSFSDGRLLGYRGAGPVSRQLLYRVGDYDIDLSIDYIEQTRAIDLIGQAMPLNADLSAVAGAAVTLLEESRVAFHTKTNPYGEFILDGIREGVYDLKLEAKGEELQIVGLNAIVRAH